MINLRGQPRRTRLAANVIYAVNRDAISAAVVLLTFNLRSTQSLLQVHLAMSGVLLMFNLQLAFM